MSDTVTAKLFEPSVQGLDHNGRATESRLWVVRQFADSHRSHIRITSDGSGMGSTFPVTLPVASENQH